MKSLSHGVEYTFAITCMSRQWFELPLYARNMLLSRANISEWTGEWNTHFFGADARQHCLDAVQLLLSFGTPFQLSHDPQGLLGFREKNATKGVNP